MNIFNVKNSGWVYTLLLIFMLFDLPEVRASVPTSRIVSPQVRFFYKKNNILLLPTYKDNYMQLRELDGMVDQYRENIGESYFSIISYVSREDARNMAALNDASLQGSVVRSYIWTHYRLPEEKFTFQIDTLGYENNQTNVELLPLPMPEGLSVIHYSVDKNPAAIQKAMSSYRRIPYVGSTDLCEQAGQKQENTECAGISTDQKNPKCAGVLMDNVRKTDSLSILVGQLRRDMDSRQRIVDSMQRADAALLCRSVPQYCESSKVPFLALKTNLVYWAGFTPEMKWKQVLPNLAMELYLGQRWSVELNGAYTNSIINGIHAKRYAFSAFGAEGRYWLRNNYRFNGFFGGVYVNGGEFDVTPKHINDDGYTGRYVGAGISLGYSYMFSSWFGLELGIRGGFRHSSYDTYYHETPHYYYKSTGYKNAIGLDGAFLNMIFRFEKCKK